MYWWLQSLLAELERPDLSGDALDQACARMQRLVEGLALPGGLLEQVRCCGGCSCLYGVSRRTGQAKGGGGCCCLVKGLALPGGLLEHVSQCR